MISIKNPAPEIRYLIIESLSVEWWNRNYFMKNSDSIAEDSLSLKLLEYNSCKIQSYAISRSFKCNVLKKSYAGVMIVRQSRVFGSSLCFGSLLTASDVSCIPGIWVENQ